VVFNTHSYLAPSLGIN